MQEFYIYNNTECIVSSVSWKVFVFALLWFMDSTSVCHFQVFKISLEMPIRKSLSLNS